MVLGKHALIDIYDVNNKYIDDINKFENLIKECCFEANLHVVDSKIFKFEPIGLSGVVFLSESHIAFHTWPEYNFVSIDAFTCGEHMKPEIVCKLIANNLGANNYNIRLMDRGTLNE